MKTRRRPPRARMARARRADRSGNARATVRGTAHWKSYCRLRIPTSTDRAFSHPAEQPHSYVLIGRDGPGKIGWKSTRLWPSTHPPTVGRPSCDARARSRSCVQHAPPARLQSTGLRDASEAGSRARGAVVRRLVSYLSHPAEFLLDRHTPQPAVCALHCTCALHTTCGRDTSGRGPPATDVDRLDGVAARGARRAPPARLACCVCAVGRGTTRPTNARAHHHINRVASSHARTPASTRQAVASRARATGGAPRLCHRNAPRLRRGAAAARVGSRLRLHFQVLFSEGFIWSPGRHAF